MGHVEGSIPSRTEHRLHRSNDTEASRRRLKALGALRFTKPTVRSLGFFFFQILISKAVFEKGSRLYSSSRQGSVKGVHNIYGTFIDPA